MYSEELRPLKRPRLGIPDVYPQEIRQKEDEMTDYHVQKGYTNKPALARECDSALGEMDSFIKGRPKDESPMVMQLKTIMKQKTRAAWVQENQKKKMTLSKEMFLPVTLMSQKKQEALSTWFQDLAGNKSLQLLSRSKIPLLMKKEEIFDLLCEHSVPMSRATWFIKMTAAHNCMLNETRVRKKQAPDPAQEWTLAVCSYLRDIANKLFRGDRETPGDPDRDPLGEGGTTSLMARWQYIVRLSQWMYNKGLLDRHEFLKSLIEFLDSTTLRQHHPTDEPLRLLLPLVVQFLSDITGCLSLARQLVKVCVKRFTALYNTGEKMAGSLRKCWEADPDVVTKMLESIDVGDPEVASSPAHSVSTSQRLSRRSLSLKEDMDTMRPPTIPSLLGKPPEDSAEGVSKETLSSGSVTRRPSAAGETEDKSKAEPMVTAEASGTESADSASKPAPSKPAQPIPPPEPDFSSYSWCSGHRTLLVTLSYVIQTIAAKCTSALVALPSKASLPSSLQGKTGTKTFKPLEVLPVALQDLPPLLDSNGEKVKALMRAVEDEVICRSKAVESGWSFADQQSPSEGGNVKSVLEVLEVLDNQLFTKSGVVSPVTALMRRMRQIMANPQTQVTDSQFVMLLCRWAITPHREGQHRPLIAAQLIKQRQNTVLKKPYHEGPVIADDDSMECCGDGVDDSTRDGRTTPSYPFQEVLFKFLECHAPQWRGAHRHATGESPFFLLMILFGELIRLGVFSYSAYLSTLIARADLVTPIVPRLMTGVDSIAEDESQNESSKPTLTISIPYVRRVKPSDPAGGSGLAKDGSFVEAKKTEAVLTSPTSSTFVIAAGSTRAPVGDTPSSAASSLATPDLLHQRANQLQQLLNQQSPDPGSFSPFGSPSLGNSPSHDFHGLSPTSITTPASTVDRGSIKVAGFPVSPAVKTKNSHHAIFAAYMPITPSILSQSIVNERLVALCGGSKGKSLVQEEQSKLEQRFLETYYAFGAQNTFVNIQWTSSDLCQHFSKLPLFYKRAIASHLEGFLRALPDQYPSTAQLCLVTDVLEQAGDFQGLVSLLVDLVAMGKKAESSSEKVAGEDWLDPAHKPLPAHLCVLVSSLLQRHMACLQLSEHNTCVVFESLCLVVKDCPLFTGLTHSQKAVFDLLLRLYHYCQYVRTTYEPFLADPLLSKIKDAHLLNTSVRPVHTTDITWIRTTLVNQLIEPSRCDVHQLSYTLNLSPKLNGFTLVCEALCLVCAPPNSHLYNPLTFDKICDLAQLVAELACLCDSVPPELLGALVAVSLPFDASYGFRQLVVETSVHSVTSPNMQNLLTFVALLVGLNTVPLTDIITRILRPLVRSYLSQSSSGPAITAQSNTLLNLLILLVLLLLVDPEDLPKKLSLSPIVDKIVENLPTVILHQLRTKRRDLGLNVLFSVLKDLLKVAQPSLQKDMTVGGGGRAGMQIHVQATPTSINEVRAALEALASQRWLGEMCHREEGKMLEKERLGEASIMPLQTRYLLMLLCPIQGTAAQKLSGLEQVDLVKDTQVGIRYILQNLDLWTLRASLLHISMLIKQTPHTSRSGVVDSLASSVIQVFEDSCSEEWVGQHMETDQGDGAHSPPIWLVTPLISKLPAIVLGRVLKNAGTVLGRGQWWSLEKSLEKKRTTRQTSTTPGKYGLQWQQPFLELVLACMKAQRTIHEELLAPLQKQLHNFLAAFEKEGLPSDELAKSTLQAALKLRLSLIGSMLLSLKDSEQHCTDWALLLLQLLVSGAVDRQMDNSESDLFTSTLDMVSTLLSWMNSDFLLVPMATGDEGKKTTVSIIRKLKSDLATSKSTCLPEIRQLFPLSPKMLEVTTVKPPAWVQHGLPEKIRGFKIQDTRDVSPWDVIEGIKNFGPLNLSWFGAVRMERRVPKYELQMKLLQSHTHKKKTVGHSFVQFADPAEIEAANTKKDIPEKPPLAQTPTDAPSGVNSTESQAQTPSSSGAPTRHPVPMATPLPTQPRPMGPIPSYGPSVPTGYPAGMRPQYPSHPSMAMSQHVGYQRQPGMVAGPSAAAYMGQGQRPMTQYRPPAVSRPMGPAAMGYPGSAQRSMEMGQIAEQRRYHQEMQLQQQHEMRIRQQQQQQQRNYLMMQQQSSAVPGQFRMPSTPANPTMMTYRQSQPRMMSQGPTMRMGMPGGTPGMSGMQSAHMQQRPLMRPQGGAPGMAPPPGGGAYPQASPQYQGAPHYRQPGFYQ